MDSKKNFTGAADMFFTDNHTNADTHTVTHDDIKIQAKEAQIQKTHEYV